MSERPYESDVAAAKAAITITIALAHSQDEMPSEDYQQGMGEILKHHPLSILHIAHYAAIALETAAAIRGNYTGTELWRQIAPSLTDDEENDDE